MSICDCGGTPMGAGHMPGCARLRCRTCEQDAPGDKPCAGCWDADKIIEHFADKHLNVSQALDNMEAEVKNNVRAEAHDVLLRLIADVRWLLEDR